MNPFKSVLAIIFLGLIRILRPIVTFRFGSLFVARLGHLAGNTECYLCEKDAGLNRPKRVIDIWCPIGKPANAQLLKMFARIIHVSKFGGAINDVASRWDWWKKHHTFNDSQWGRDIHNLMEKQPSHLKFTRTEEREGRRLLKTIGMPEGVKWVCIINRDPMYLRVMEPAQDYTYHSFRDSNIDNYREAALALIDRGYSVIRMGRHVAAPMKLSGPGFFDYAVSELRSDFADVYLGAKCEFCITNGTGFDGIPMVFRRPLCFVNEAPFEYLSTWLPKSLAIWKHHIKAGKRMMPAEIIASGAGLFNTSKQFADAGISLDENTPSEIKDLVLEMIGVDTPNEAGNAAQDAFWKAFPRSKSPFNSQPLHGEIRLRIGSKFLSQYAD